MLAICSYQIQPEHNYLYFTMLSICIPVYNFDVTELVNELIRQSSQTNYPVEVLVFDDYSQEYYRSKNSCLAQLPNVSYLEFDFNIGRSRIRNRLGDFAKGEWLLFLDCDTIPETPNFIKNYINKLGKAKVIYGGRTYWRKPTHSELTLRWKYGIKRECTKAILRQNNPYKSFMSSNFVIEKDTFSKVRFNEDLSGYGHEDTLLGIELKHSGFNILHIDNPTRHLGLESSTDFMEKTTQAVLNLARILNMMPNSRLEIEKSIKLLNIFRIARHMGLLYPLRWISKVFTPMILKHLSGNNPSVNIFDVYKLSLLAKIYSKNWEHLRVN